MRLFVATNVPAWISFGLMTKSHDPYCPQSPTTTLSPATGRHRCSPTWLLIPYTRVSH